MSIRNVLPIVFKELEEQLAQYQSLVSQKQQTAEDIRKTERRVELIKELLELEGAEVDAHLEQRA